MAPKKSYFQELTSTDFNKIKALASKIQFKKDQMIFAEGDTADHIYFIESGSVSIFIQKFTSQEQICQLGPGQYFGEMAFFLKDTRTASVMALEDTTLLSVDKDSFMGLVKNDRAIAYKIDKILAKRCEELILKENLVDTTGINSKHLHISIKGDPSLRETSFTRERYESVVDTILPRLQLKLAELLLHRCTYQLFIGFNNGEVRTASIFDPFNEKIHQAHKLLDEAYLDRHFPQVNYDEKAWMLKRLYTTIAEDHLFSGLDKHFQKTYTTFYNNWEPITPDEISGAIFQLSTLRNIEDFYIRNFTIGIAQDAIRVQFNCDGTHFVSAEDYQTMLKENL